MKKFITIISILLMATAGYAQGKVHTETELKVQFPFGEANSTESSKTYTVERVIDGDTLKLTNGEKLTVNLDVGSLGNLKIGHYADVGKFINEIGEIPDEITDDIFVGFYRFRNRGLTIEVVENRIYSFIIYLTDSKTYLADSDTTDGYSRFPGLIKKLDNEDSIETILEKFGVDCKNEETFLGKYPMLACSSNYGILDFIFDKNKRLFKIVMSSNN